MSVTSTDGGNPAAWRLLDALPAQNGLKNDAALSRMLKVNQAIISKVRNGRCVRSADLLVRMHDTFSLSLKDLRVLLGGHECLIQRCPAEAGAARWRGRC